MHQRGSIDRQTGAIDALVQITSEAFQLEGPYVGDRMEAPCTLPFASAVKSSLS